MSGQMKLRPDYNVAPLTR